MATGQAVYWIGANGNVYLKAPETDTSGRWTVTDMGKIDLSRGEVYPGAVQIADPSAKTPTGQVTGPTGPAGPVLNTAAVDATNQAINSLGVEQQVAYQNIDDSLRSVIGKYDREAGRNEEDYTGQTVTNNTNLQKNKQNALVAGAQGRRGLRSTLAAMGALGGTGGELADRAVMTEANNDIGEATETAATNAGNLDKAIGRFRDEDRERRAEAQTSAANSRTAAEGSIASKRQQYFQKLAEIYKEGGDNANAAKYLAMAGGLNNEIASKSRVAAAPITERTAAFAPGDLDQYLAGAGDMTVEVRAGGNDGGGDVNTLLAGRKRDEEKKRQLVAA